MEESYNEWFVGKVEEALNSDEPTKDHEEVMKTLRDSIENIEKTETKD